jgi:hypothetical protein
LLAALSACENQGYEDVFDKPPVERRKEFFDQLQSTLVAPGKAWVMQYFITPESPGYNFYADFKLSGEVKMGAKNTRTANIYKEYTSRYGLSIENGPALIFSTYNEILHTYSDPDISQSIAGDFEFVVLDLTDDLIKLKGKKSGSEVWLNRLAANTTGEEYIQQSDVLKNFLFPIGGPDFILEAAGKTYSFTEGYTSIFKIKESGVDTLIELPYITTPTGFRLYKPLEIGEMKIQNFQLSSDKNKLLCTDKDANVELTIANGVAGFFINSLSASLTNSWKVDKDNLGGAFAAAYSQIVDNCKAKYNEDFDSFFFTYKPARRNLTLSFKSGKYEGAFNFDIALKEGTANQIVFTNKNAADTNGNVYLKNISGFDTFLNELSNGNYIITTESPLSMSTVKLVSVSNPDNCFRLILN